LARGRGRHAGRHLGDQPRRRAHAGKSALVYLVIGVAIGPWGAGWLLPDPDMHRVLLERAAEIAVLISLFATGSVVGTTLRVAHWRVPVRLATGAMVVTVLLLAAFAHWVLDLSVGASLVLAGALAPTDPVLAGDVQVADARDRDRLRFGLTGEAGLNDGAAFPFVLAGLALLGVDGVASENWLSWILHACWGVAGGLGLGAALGFAAGRWVARRTRDGVESETSEAFLGLGIVAASYGLALLVGAYGFLAVFAAAVALRYAAADKDRDDRTAITPVERFNADLESLFEFAVVIVCGALVTIVSIPIAAVAPRARPLPARASRLGMDCARRHGARARAAGACLVVRHPRRGLALLRLLRGEPRLARPEADYVLGLVLGVVAASIVLHGISVTPLMNAYERHAQRMERS
jgi:NhaP-type Na+/H+ or K+/H+ antiporter